MIKKITFEYYLISIILMAIKFLFNRFVHYQQGVGRHYGRKCSTPIKRFLMEGGFVDRDGNIGNSASHVIKTTIVSLIHLRHNGLIPSFACFAEFMLLNLPESNESVSTLNHHRELPSSMNPCPLQHSSVIQDSIFGYRMPSVDNSTT